MRQRFSVQVGKRRVDTVVERLGEGRYRLLVDNVERVVDARRLTGTNGAATWSLLPEGGGALWHVDVDGNLPDLVVGLAGQSFPVRVEDARALVAERAAARPAASGPETVSSLMAGKVVKILVAAGEGVKAGQGVIVVEAMKMENELRAARDGKVARVHVTEGAAVEAGQGLVTIE